MFIYYANNLWNGYTTYKPFVSTAIADNAVLWHSIFASGSFEFGLHIQTMPII